MRPFDTSGPQCSSESRCTFIWTNPAHMVQTRTILLLLQEIKLHNQMSHKEDDVEQKG